LFWEDKRVLVTGADGFAGAHLCEELLKEGAEVRAFIRSGAIKNLESLEGIEIARGDVLDAQSLKNAMKQIDIVFHAAALTLIPETRAMMTNTFSINAGGTLNVLLAAKERAVKRVVYVSTCHVYGKQENFPITEESRPNPIDIYSSSKLAAEHLCTSFVKMFGLDVLISRAFNHFGPRQRQEFLIPEVITKLLREDELTLGNPKPTRDYSYVKDVVRGYLLLAQHGQPDEVYHFCTGVERSVKEILETIIRVGGFSSEPKWNPAHRKVDIPRSYGDFSKAKRELGWEPKVSFEEGIRKTIEWYKDKLA